MSKKLQKKIEYENEWEAHNAMMLKKDGLIEILRNADSNDEVHDQVVNIIESCPKDWFMPNTKKKDGTSVLMIAARQGLVRLVKYLMDNGARVTSVNRDHCDALMFACVSGKRDIVEPILLAGADIKFKTKQGITALMIAADRGHESIVKMLLEEAGAVLDAKMKKGYNALAFAVAGGHIATVEVLLDAKADPNSDYKGVTPLMLAAHNNQPQIISLLISRNADVNTAREGSEETALHFAAAVQGGAKACVQRLLDANASVQSHDSDGRLPLHFAANNPEIATLLTRAGADVNMPDDGGNTALMFACAQQTPPIALLNLISAKANVDTKNQIGETALSIAADLGKNDLVNMLSLRMRQKTRK